MRLIMCLLFVLTFAAVPAVAEPSNEIQAALRQKVSLEFDNFTLDQCAERLRTMTKVIVVVHESLRPLLDARDKKLQNDAQAAPMDAGAPPIELSAPSQSGFSCSLRHLPLSAALLEFLEHYGLGYFADGDTITIATADRVRQLQREALTTLKLDNVPLSKALDDLASRHGFEASLITKISPEPNITLNVRKVSVENALHLLADAAGLKAAPLGNGWIVTSAEKAKEWQSRAERRAADKDAIVTLGSGTLGGGFGIIVDPNLNIAGGNPGIGGIGLGGLGGGVLPGQFENVKLPRALLQVAGPSPRTGQAPEKSAPLTPQPKQVEARKSLAAETLKKMNVLSDVSPEGPMTLREAFKHFEDHGAPRFVVRQTAFKQDAAGGGDIDILESQVKWPVKGLSRAKTLRLMLDQIPSDNASYLVKAGYVEITTYDAAKPNGQFVQADFTQRPLDEVLLELSEMTGISIVLDPRVGDRGRAPLTARFPAETNLVQAARLLADMADLKAVVVDYVVYVTTRSNATVFPEEPLGIGKHTRRDVAQ